MTWREEADATNGRQSIGAAAAGPGGASQPGPAAGAAPSGLPCVKWGRYEVSRLCVGHNLLKGQSHFRPGLDRWSMATAIRQPSKPCLVFKVLGANRH